MTTHVGVGYVTPSPQSELETDGSLPSQSSDSSSWDSTISVGIVFKMLFANMTSINQAEKDENVEPFDTDPWAQYLNLQWEKHCE